MERMRILLVWTSGRIAPRGEGQIVHALSFYFFLFIYFCMGAPRLAHSAPWRAVDLFCCSSPAVRVILLAYHYATGAKGYYDTIEVSSNNPI